MSLLIKQRSRVRDTQPQVPVAIDWNNPLTLGLEFVCVGGILLNLVNGSKGSIQGTVTVINGHKGRAWTTSSGTSRVEFESGVSEPPTEVTYGSVFRYTENGFFQYLIMKNMVGVDGSTPTMLMGIPAIGAGDNRLQISFGDTGLYRSNENIPQNTWLVGSGSSPGVGESTTAKLFLNGVKLARNSASVDDTNNAGANNYIRLNGRQTDGNRILNGSQAFSAVWSRVLTDREHISWNENPWQILARTRRRIWVPVSGSTAPGATITGTGSVTAGAATADSTAPGATITGTGTLTAGDATGTGDATAPGATVTGTGSVTAGAATADSTAPGATITGTGSVVAGAATGISLRADYERSSINLSNSTVVGAGDSAIISIMPRFQASEVVGGEQRWLEPSARVDGVNGFRPTFRFLSYKSSGTGSYHGYPWDSTRRPMFSYDRVTWTYFDTATPNSTNQWVEFRHNTAFTQDTVYIARSRQISVAQIGQWIEDFATTYAGKVEPVPSAVAFTPTLTGWPAQAYICDEFSAQTNELGQTIPATPLYGFMINDTSLMPVGGGPKILAQVTSGVHAGEDYGTYLMMAFAHAVMANTAWGQNVRRNYKIKFEPCLNAPGRAGGGWRGSFTLGSGGIDDANRHFPDATPGLEIVTKPRTAMAADRSGYTKMDWMMDFHATYINQWSIVIDTGNTLHSTFSSRLSTYTGKTFNDEGESPAGCVTKYFESTVKVPLSVTFEMGDKTTVSDAELDTVADGVVRTLGSMLDDGLLGTAVGAALTGAGSVTAGAATADSTAPGATLTGTGTLTAGSATGTGDAVADGATITGTGSVTAGAATADSQAPGATITGTGSVVAGDASGGGAGDATAPSASLTGTGSVTAGAATADSTAPGATITGSGLIIGGSTGLFSPNDVDSVEYLEEVSVEI